MNGIDDYTVTEEGVTQEQQEIDEDMKIEIEELDIKRQCFSDETSLTEKHIVSFHKTDVLSENNTIDSFSVIQDEIDKVAITSACFSGETSLIEEDIVLIETPHEAVESSKNDIVESSSGIQDEINEVVIKRAIFSDGTSLIEEDIVSIESSQEAASESNIVESSNAIQGKNTFIHNHDALNNDFNFSLQVHTNHNFYALIFNSFLP